ncbi:Flagellar M-ring protein [Candidatus Cyrtobacter comes]|uniref:Flagellar M-ring protein n=1 Tax=Candidatus Cyrtobacter comes TaxID=675776 RepID=A0ABU5L8S8_9RICK|nr:flagellar basal-body MS-ring/collar protein FliF [Candidatus Cyrtobacter comes]MDZ5762523.1 Flagellar M-ring protein [Candidatus Cyrtobacter comes]
MEFLNRFWKNKIFIIATASSVAIAVVVAVILIFSKQPMEVLYSSLSQEDSSLIVERLRSMGIPYNVSGDGKQISVPSDRMLSIRLSLAQEGIPSSGSIVGYEIFDKTDGIGTSQFVYNINLVRALEGELSRTISSISSINSARVHLVIPKKELFSRSASTPSASVILKTKYSDRLSRKEISAIAHMVSTAVPELRVDNVTIIDDQGNPLKINSEKDDFLMSQGAIEYKNSIEKKIMSSVEEMLTSYVGHGRVKVHATAEIDLDHEVINSEVFDPESQAIRSRKISEENEKEEDRKNNNVSVENNVPNLSSKVGPPTASRNKGRSDEIINYEVSRTTTNKVREYGQLKRLSVAILVDGRYVTDQNGKRQYQERSAEEISKIKSLASSAIGIDESRGDKIEVLNLQFIDLAEPEVSSFDIVDFLRRDGKGIMQVIVVGIVAILVLYLVVKPMVLKFTSPEIEEGEGLQQQSLAQQAVNDELAQTNEDDKLNEVIKKDTDSAVSIIRGWLNEKSL